MNQPNIENHLLILVSIFLLLPALVLNAEVNQSYERPNRIIFILSDDHRYDYMGFMDTIEWLQTPNLDLSLIHI